MNNRLFCKGRVCGGSSQYHLTALCELALALLSVTITHSTLVIPNVSAVSHHCCTAPKKKCSEPFDVWPVSRFDREFPHFRLPSELGCFSLDASRDYIDSRSHLRVYRPPSDRSVSWDLSHGYSIFIQRDESKKEYIDHLLKWVQLNGCIKSPSSGSDAGACRDDGSICR